MCIVFWHKPHFSRIRMPSLKQTFATLRTNVQPSSELFTENMKISISILFILPVPRCHAIRRKHDGWDTARLSKPRQEQFRLSSNLRSSGQKDEKQVGSDLVLNYDSHSKVSKPPDTHSEKLSRNW
ncbi:hypothetical protein T265_07723 [Opisthorchis viverrini]|uniref:Uncharacterized protein n=1 Tax=Opisthorchis viverrini TaxID=6198 RepID=A0A074ZMY1_OPIVI|nr:hypothetical protein T265_07723 [Opisthorchis viverrini]KER24675.1 hypothetical protein T265_07723 [Opisthorchis viverrini]